MPEKETQKRAAADKKSGKSASTQAGEYVREEMHHIREGKHGARNTKQAIAIGLSKARRNGVELKAPAKSSATDATREKPGTIWRPDIRMRACQSTRNRRQNASLESGPDSVIGL